jgi:hypothetical protein
MRGKKVPVLSDRQELSRELAILRTRVDEIAQQYSLGVKARIDEVLHTLALPVPEAGHVLPEPRVVEKIVRKMKRLKEKPQKGRAKDLKRIQDLVDSVNAAVLCGD